ncbi:MAG: hypothetical protein HY290_25680 [Planctomycetia bacterium]|nr:hypothetical protein [Planctomycetia bacterium]
MSFDPKLLDKILVCTKCRSSLVRDGEALVCVTRDCRRRFSIQHEIPNMLMEEAAVVPDAEWSTMMVRAGRDPATGTQIGSP